MIKVYVKSIKQLERTVKVLSSFVTHTDNTGNCGVEIEGMVKIAGKFKKHCLEALKKQKIKVKEVMNDD